MANTIISVRIPASLLEEFREVSKKDHYLDLSEAVRSIIRKRWSETEDPLSNQIKKLRQEITKNIENKNHELLLKELEKIRDSIIKDEKE